MLAQCCGRQPNEYFWTSTEAIANGLRVMSLDGW